MWSPQAILILILIVVTASLIEILKLTISLLSKKYSSKLNLNRKKIRLYMYVPKISFFFWQSSLPLYNVPYCHVVIYLLKSCFTFSAQGSVFSRCLGPGATWDNWVQWKTVDHFQLFASDEINCCSLPRISIFLYCEDHPRFVCKMQVVRLLLDI